MKHKISHTSSQPSKKPKHENITPTVDVKTRLNIIKKLLTQTANQKIIQQTRQLYNLDETFNIEVTQNIAENVLRISKIPLYDEGFIKAVSQQRVTTRFKNARNMARKQEMSLQQLEQINEMTLREVIDLKGDLPNKSLHQVQMVKNFLI